MKLYRIKQAGNQRVGRRWFTSNGLRLYMAMGNSIKPKPPEDVEYIEEFEVTKTATHHNVEEILCKI